MEKLEIGEVAQLENGKEFICCGVINDNDEEYLIMMSNFKPIEIKFAKQDIVNEQLQLTIIENSEQKQKLFEIYSNSVKQ